jgi:hypothetical protein
MAAGRAAYSTHPPSPTQERLIGHALADLHKNLSFEDDDEPTAERATVSETGIKRAAEDCDAMEGIGSVGRGERI